MNDSFKYQTAADQRELALYLTRLAQGVEAGTLTVAEGNMGFTLKPRGLADLAVKVRRKQGRTKISLDISWVEDAGETGPETGP